MFTIIAARRAALIAAKIGCTVLVIGAVFLWIYQLTAGVKVNIINNTGTEIKNLRIQFTGGETLVPLVKPGEIYSMIVNPSGESSLRLQFTDMSDNRHSREIGTYLEEGYRGEILIEIGPNGKVTYEDNSRIGHFHL